MCSNHIGIAIFILGVLSWKNYLLFFLLFLFFSGCSNLNFWSKYKENKIKKQYTQLSKRFDSLVSEEIEEDKRAELEEDFSKYRNRINSSGGKNQEYNNTVRELVLSSDIKIQYLKDLKD